LRALRFISCLLLVACLAGCRWGGKDNASDSSSSPTPPASGPQRGDLLTSPPPLVASYSTDQVLAVLTGSDLGKTLLSLAYTPKCSLNIYQLSYETVGGKGEPAKASGALMIPTGSDTGCQGPLPVLVYAHGTSPDKTYNIALIDKSNAGEGLLLAAVFASRGYIVVAPNYAGYDTSDLPYHPYLNADQQSKEMIDVLSAARSALPLSSLRDAQAAPDGGFPAVSTGIPAASPTNTLRQDLKTNDLRNWSPQAPVLLCAGDQDPTVFYLNTQLMQQYWSANAPASSVTVLDVDSAVTSGDPYGTLKNEFAAAKALVAANAVAGGAKDGGALAVLQAYHAGLVPPICLSGGKILFRRIPMRVQWLPSLTSS
jgi:hypothetical protein